MFANVGNLFGMLQNVFSIHLDNIRYLWYNHPREGVASAFGVVSQHPGRLVWLALNCETHVCLQPTWSLIFMLDTKYGCAMLGFFYF